MDRRSFLHVALAATTTALVPGHRGAQAQSGGAAGFPAGLVRIVVPFSPGSMTDILARSIADKLGARWKQNVVIENKPGIAGTASVAKSAPDGLTIMLTSNGHAVIALVNPNVNFDPLKDFAGVTQVASMPSILIVPPDSPARSLADLIAAARAKPGSLNYSSAEVGSSTNMAGELFAQSAKIDIVHVPYRGMPDAQTAVLRGDAALCFTFFNVGGDLIQAGKLRALAVTGSKRMSQLPDVPTFAEAGLPGFTYDAWFGIFTPRGVAAPIIEKMNQDIVAILQLPEIKAHFEAQGVDLVTTSPEKFDQLVQADAARFAWQRFRKSIRSGPL
jgi:tripartite-type tricarboxylate transporter receptor subunit TctC